MRWLLSAGLALLAGMPLLCAQQPAPDAYTQHMEAGVDALLAQRFPEAAAAFRQAMHDKPESSQAATLAGEALVYGRQPAAAIPPLQTATRLEENSVMARELLAAAYAGADMPRERDAQRTLLRDWATDGQHPTLTRVPSFLLETLWLGAMHVNVTDYLVTTPAQPVLMRFLVRDRAEVIEGSYCLAPVTGPNTGNRFALESCMPGANQPAKVFATMPDYSELRGIVVQVVKRGLRAATIARK